MVLDSNDIIGKSIHNPIDNSDRDTSSVKIIFTRDFCPRNNVENLIVTGQFGKIYNDVYPTLLKKDLSVTNLECPITDKSSPIKKVDQI